MRIFRALMAVALLACLSPLIAMAIADAIAQWHGCKLDLVTVHPCIVGGEDIGHTLLTLAFMGYFLMATFPVAIGVLSVWIIIEVAAWWRRRAARTAA